MDTADITIIAIVAVSMVVVPALGLFRGRDENEDEMPENDGRAS